MNSNATNMRFERGRARRRGRRRGIGRGRGRGRGYRGRGGFRGRNGSHSQQYNQNACPVSCLCQLLLQMKNSQNNAKKVFL